jgi:CDP-6-deoxy-D-xylo-4-hexulose-3-dehydrase
MTCNIYPGSIYKIPFPFTDLSETKARPALALSSPDIYGDVRFVFITTVPPEAEEYGLELKKSDYDGEPLPFNSYLRLDKIYLLNRSIVIKQMARLNGHAMDGIIREEIFQKVTDFYTWGHTPATFIPGKSRIPFAGRVYDEKEMVSLVDSSLDFWLTAGRYAAEFEKKFADFLGVKHCSLTNSGSSANLLAFMALTSPKLGDRRIGKGDEVITVAAGFPTTVAPIIQYGAVPVFVDVTLPGYNIDCDQLDAALSGKTKAVMLAHTLGNPFDIARVLAFCRKHNLWLIEDCCDALGASYSLPAASSQLPTPHSTLPTKCGAFGDLATFSFYPAHHITMGEGGAVCSNDVELKRIVESLRDWGRDCWCVPGRDNTCGRRFDQQFGELPLGYDHKYVYSHFGYNLKVTDMQAAVGCAQLEKLPGFIEARKKNWKYLREGLLDLSDRFILPEPTQDSDPSWFGFLLTVRENAGFTRDDMVTRLEKAGIQTRMLFAGNLIKHPCFDEMRKSGHGYRIVSSSKLHAPSSQLLTPNSALQSQLPITDRIMRDTFWIGVYPGMTDAVIDYMISCIKEFKGKRHAS